MKNRWCDWDSNPGDKDVRCRSIYWATENKSPEWSIENIFWNVVKQQISFSFLLIQYFRLKKKIFGVSFISSIESQNSNSIKVKYSFLNAMNNLKNILTDSVKELKGVDGTAVTTLPPDPELCVQNQLPDWVSDLSHFLEYLPNAKIGNLQS